MGAQPPSPSFSPPSSPPPSPPPSAPSPMPASSPRHAKPFAPLAPPREHPPHVKLLACAALVAVQLFASIVLKLAHRGGFYAFSPQSSLVLSEAAKIALSLLYLLQQHRSPRAARRALLDELSPRLAAHMLGLAAIYCVNNALMFWLFARADPGSITLIKSGATIVSAAMLYAWRRFALSPERWAVIVLQMAGLVVAQYDACAGKSHLAVPVYAGLVVSLVNSSLANVWNEHVVKRFDGASLATKNVLLYAFGALLNLVGFVWSARQGKGPRFWEGYGSAAAVLVVLSNACMGIAMNVVYKYADALVKNIATTTTTVVLLGVSAWMFDGRADVMVFLGGGVVVIGTGLYFRLGVMEVRWKEMEKKIATGGGVGVL